MFHLKQLEPKVFPSHGPTRYRTACESQPGCWRCGVQKFFRFHPHTTCDSCDERMYSCFAGIGLWLLRRFQLKRPPEIEGRKQRCVLQHTTIPGIQLKILASFKTPRVVRHSVARSIKQLMEPKMGQNFFEDMGILTETHDHSRPQDVKHPFGMLDFI